MPLPLFLIRSSPRTKRVEYGASITHAKRSRVTLPFFETANTSYFNESLEVWNFSGNWWGATEL